MTKIQLLNCAFCFDDFLKKHSTLWLPKGENTPAGAFPLPFPNKLFHGRREHSMANNTPQLTFTFEDPNTPEAFERMLKALLIDRLLSLQARGA